MLKTTSSFSLAINNLFSYSSIPTILLLVSFDFFPLKYLLKVLSFLLKTLNPLLVAIKTLESETIIEISLFPASFEVEIDNGFNGSKT